MISFIRVLLIALLLASSVHAADMKPKTPAPVIVVIDVQRVLQESAAARSVQKQLDTQRAKFQTVTEKEENELRAAEQELSGQHDKVAADVYADREQQLRQKFLAVERRVESRRKVLDQAFTESMNEVRSNLLTITQAIAHDRGANLVLIKQQALWADPSFDVTNDVLDRMNKTLPQVLVKIAPEDK